jgi:hypothetical protein
MSIYLSDRVFAQPFFNRYHLANKQDWHTFEFSSKDQRLKHQDLYDFWLRSEGFWFSKLAKITIQLIEPSVFVDLAHSHQLQDPEFGIRINWEYSHQQTPGQMIWCVDAAHPSLVFTNQSISPGSLPSVYQYRMLSDNSLVTTDGHAEETNWLKQDHRRLREIRRAGKLIRRIWENKLNT